MAEPTNDDLNALWKRIIGRGSDKKYLSPPVDPNPSSGPIYDFTEEDKKIIEEEVRMEREKKRLMMEHFKMKGDARITTREEIERELFEKTERAKLEQKRRMVEAMTSDPFAPGGEIGKGPLSDFIKKNPFSSDKIVDQNKEIEKWFKEYVKESDVLKKMDSQIHRYNELYTENINPGYSINMVVNLAAITKQHIMVSFAINLVGGLKEEALICETRNLKYTTSRSEFRDELTKFLVYILVDMVYPAMFKISSSAEL
jgi:hypothetical protein